MNTAKTLMYEMLRPRTGVYIIVVNKVMNDLSKIFEYINTNLRETKTVINNNNYNKYKALV
jgi:hypothetical protein